MMQVQQQSGVKTIYTGGIQQGMPVYDNEDVMLGIVAQIHHGEETDVFAPAVDDHMETIFKLPAAVQTHLWREGYLEVQTGLYSSNYFVLPYQISSITEDGIFLMCYRDELIQF